MSAGSGAAILPTIAARGNGVVAVLYLQLDAGARLPGRYRIAVSVDGANHFRARAVSPTFAVTDAPRLTATPLVPGGYFLGDYMGLAPIGGRSFGVLFVVARRQAGNPTDVFYASIR